MGTRTVLYWGLAVCTALPAGAQQGPANVVVTPVVERTVRDTKTFLGTVRPQRHSLVASEVDGSVVEFVVREGDRVEKGQPLAKLKTTTLEIRLAGRKAIVAAGLEALRELENGSRPEQIEGARASLESAAAEVAFRRWKLDSAKSLYDRGSFTEDDLKEATYNLDNAQARGRRLKALLVLAEKGPRKERILQARARLLQLQTEARELEEQLTKHVIRAPFAGYVVEEHTEVGEWLSQGDPVVELFALDSVEIEVGVPGSSIQQIELGSEAQVRFSEIPDEMVTGRVVKIVPRAEVRTRAFPVRVLVKNRVQRKSVVFKAGMLARVTLQVGKTRKALLVPKDALRLGGPQPVVVVVREGKAQMLPVELGVSQDDLIEVRGELKPGQQVVVRGNETLRPGQDLEVAGQ